MGHFEVKACPIVTGEVATQACFDAYPLTFVSDDFYDAPADPHYPGRAYIPRSEYSTQKTPDNAYLFRHQFKLPDGLRGDLVLLQWYYLTGNSCLPPGYSAYAWPVGFNPGSQLPACGQIPSDGRGVPEQFWNCAEVKIAVGCGTSPTPPAPATPTTLKPTTLKPTASEQIGTPTGAPTNAPSTKPVQPTTNVFATTTCAGCPSGATGLYALDGCLAFRNCLSGVDKGIITCPAGTLFDETLGICNWASEVKCNCQASSIGGSPTAAPTSNPTKMPTVTSTPTTTTSSKPTTAQPSTKPTTAKPSEKPTTSKPTTATPSTTFTVKPTTAKPSTATPTTSKPVLDVLSPTSSPVSRPPTSSVAAKVEEVLETNKDGIDNKVLLYQTPQSTWIPSTVYRYQDLLDGLRVMYNDGVANKFFFMGDDSPNGYKYGLVNIAAFLAQSMKETIQYNACDENSWDLVNGKYPLSNACGQLGQSYQDYQCSASEAHMACTVNPNMEIRATTNAKWYGAPGPLFCAPKSKVPFTGFWDYAKECNKPWDSPPSYCSEYEGQKAGGYDNSSPVANSMGRTDVEGCCFWGRGVIQTTGVCNFGKLNYYLGQRAADEGRASRYPDINFCEEPNAICDSEEHKELKWIAGMFYWVEELQSYNVGGWNYIKELQKFVDGGMKGSSFIDAVSGIVNRGCHDPPCAAGPVDGLSDRSSNFSKVLKELKLVA